MDVLRVLIAALLLAGCAAPSYVCRPATVKSTGDTVVVCEPLR